MLKIYGTHKNTPSARSTHTEGFARNGIVSERHSGLKEDSEWLLQGQHYSVPHRTPKLSAYRLDK